MLSPLLAKLKETGVQHLNLHQLRATPHNAGNLIQRGYTFLHGPKVTVLESELAALRMIKYASDHGIGLPINYCSFVYKNGFQTLAYRKRLAAFLCKTFESITAAGAVRRMSLKGQPGHMDEVIRIFRKNGCNENLWRLDNAGSRLSFHPSLRTHIDHSRVSLSLEYYLPFLSPAVSYRHSFVEIPLNRHKTVILEKRPALKEKALTLSEAKIFEKWFLADGDEGKAHLGATSSGKSPQPPFGKGGRGGIFPGQALSEQHWGKPGESSMDPDLSRHDAIGEGLGPLEDIAELERIKPGLQEYY
ncbi:MAG: hypothetical protein MUO52_15815 [Desulfobacterales bacterium]|nr:hypothetical protein [Desulfobacterales bacterium]